MLAQRERRSKAGLLRHAFDRRIAGFQQPLRMRHALIQQPLLEGCPGRLPEMPGEVPPAHGRTLGEHIDGMGLRQMLRHPTEHFGKAAIAAGNR